MLLFRTTASAIWSLAWHNFETMPCGSHDDGKLATTSRIRLVEGVFADKTRR